MAKLRKPKDRGRRREAHRLPNTPSSEETYDLDDPQLVARLLIERPDNYRGITCRFLAMPVSKPNCFSYDISQYGQIIHEDRNKLIMRLPAEGFDVLSHIRQIWVSKYLAPSTECTISFSLPASSGRNKNATLVIIQRVVPKTDDNTAAPSTSDATKKNSTSTIPAPKTTSGAHHTPSTVDGNGNKVALPAPVFGGRNSTLVATQRRRATSLPTC